MCRLPVCFLLSLLILLGCNKEGKKTPEARSTALDLLRGEIVLCGSDQLGEIEGLQSCQEKARKDFQLGFSLLHSFEYEEAEKAFAKVIDKDPDCVMAYWGVAMSNFHALWLQEGDAYLKKGEKVLARTESLPKTEKEKDYLEAIAALYTEWETTDRTTRIVRFEHKMAALHRKYQDDAEAAIFYALALTASADPADTTYTNQRKAGKLLEALALAQPNHPGIAHYLIHTYDYPELAHLALPMARRYAAIAPASAHAQHMPSHIFTRLGLWEESIKTNLNSTASARCYAESISPGEHWDEELHSMDYLVYAYLQLGENRKAREQAAYLNTFTQVFPENFKVAYATAAIPARIALENKDWPEAAKLHLPPSLKIHWEDFPWQEAMIHYARALGAIHTGDLKSGNQELASLLKIHALLLAQNDTYKAKQVQVQETTVQAWMLYAVGKQKAAISLMEEAAKLEKSMAKHPVTPGELLPAEELLGDLYLDMGDFPQALDAYEADLRLHPNRFNGIYGAATAARKAGNKSKAIRYYQQLLRLTAASQSSRPEVKEARRYLKEI